MLPEWCPLPHRGDAGTHASAKYSGDWNRGSGAPWRHDDSAHVLGEREVEVSACATGLRGDGGGERQEQLWRQPAFPACPGAAGLALTNLNEEPQRFRRHFRVMPDLINLAGGKG